MIQIQHTTTHNPSNWAAACGRALLVCLALFLSASTTIASERNGVIPDSVLIKFADRAIASQLAQTSTTNRDTIAQSHSQSLAQSLPQSLPQRSDSSDTTMPPFKSGLQWDRIAIATGGLAAAIGGFHIYQANAWWSNDRTRFHVIEDPDYQADFDKFGHTFGAYYGSHFFDEAFLWSGMDSAQATVFGAFAGALWEFYVEIEDGFAYQWGFSRGDAKSDILGATVYLATKRIPFLRNVSYKIMYFPSEKYLQNKPDIPGQSLNFIEDYGGQSYWLTFDIHGMLPEAAKPYWPSWLNLAAGAGGYNLDSIDSSDGFSNIFRQRRKAWYIGLDYDLDKLIPESSSGFLNFIRRSLHYLHFPAPAYRVYPDPRLFVLFPFKMTIG